MPPFLFVASLNACLLFRIFFSFFFFFFFFFFGLKMYRSKKCPKSKSHPWSLVRRRRWTFWSMLICTFNEPYFLNPARRGGRSRKAVREAWSHHHERSRRLKDGYPGLPMVFPGTRVSFIDAVTRFRAEDWIFRYPSGK